jgi:probable rRNA maturation factor
MNRIEIAAEEVPLPPWEKAAGRFLKKVFAWLGKDCRDLSILFCGDRYIRSLNVRFRNRDEATDVLSFSLNETLPSGRFLPGDIVISLDTLRKNARRFNIEEDEELRRLLVHGVLHLEGMDHAGNSETEPMLRLQERILAEIPGHILPAAGKVLSRKAAPSRKARRQCVPGETV